MAKIDDEKGEVVFFDSEGNEISNSPTWLAKKTLEAAGIAFAQSQPADLQAALVAQSAPAAVAHNDDDETLDDETPEDTDDAGNRTYKELVKGELASFAKSRGVEVKGRTAREVRDDLIAQDTEERAKAEVEKANAEKAAAEKAAAAKAAAAKK